MGAICGVHTWTRNWRNVPGSVSLVRKGGKPLLSTPSPVELAYKAMGQSPSRTCKSFLGKMFLVIVDTHLKWPEVLEMHHTTAEKTIETLRSVFSTHRLSEQVVSDNAPQCVRRV